MGQALFTHRLTLNVPAAPTLIGNAANYREFRLDRVWTLATLYGPRRQGLVLSLQPGLPCRGLCHTCDVYASGAAPQQHSAGGVALPKITL